MKVSLENTFLASFSFFRQLSLLSYYHRYASSDVTNCLQIFINIYVQKLLVSQGIWESEEYAEDSISVWLVSTWPPMFHDGPRCPCSNHVVHIMTPRIISGQIKYHDTQCNIREIQSKKIASRADILTMITFRMTLYIYIYLCVAPY